MKLHGKVAIVTGAARGMGKQHCLSMAREGANIAAVDIGKGIPAIKNPLGTKEELNATVEEVKRLGRSAIGVNCDVSKSDEVQAAVQKVLAEFGRIDILVNNAGIVTTNRIVDMTEEEWDKVIDVNLKGTWLFCKYVLPHMIAQRSGKIVNIGSTAGREGNALFSSYSASKGGVHSLTLAVAREVGTYNINVNAIGPGIINTPLQQYLAPHHARYMNVKIEEVIPTRLKFNIFAREVTIEDVSNAVVFLASEDSRSITGQVIYVDGGHR